MRIALVHPYTWPHTRRGGERYLHDLAAYLMGAGHDVTILSSYGGRDAPGHAEVEGVEVRKLWARPGARLRSLPPSLREPIEAHRIRASLTDDWDVVHAFWPAAARAAASRYPTVYTLLGMPSPETDPRLAARLGRAANRATVAAALSTPAFESARAMMPARWIVLPAGIRSERFPAAPAPSGPVKILFSASLSTRYKGLPVVLQAFASVLRRRPDVELVLSGSGAHDWALDELEPDDRRLVEANLRVTGTATRAEADALYAEASVMVLPSRHEALGLSVLEALATGCPVVVADDGGPREIVGDADVGAALPAQDHEAIADGLLTWIDRSAQPTVRAACRARAMVYDWASEIGPQHEAVYEATRRGDDVVPSWTGPS